MTYSFINEAVRDIATREIARENVINQYRIWLNREPDEAGLEGYVDRIVDDGWTIDMVSDSLNTSEEFYRTAGQQVDRWYESILGRPADSDGREHYIDQIRRVGFEQLGPIEDTFYNSPEYQGDTPPPPDTGPPEEGPPDP